MAPRSPQSQLWPYPPLLASVQPRVVRSPECHHGLVGVTITLSRRFCGPRDSANGGYTAGVLAQHLRATAEVTLRRPPPLEQPLVVELEDRRILLRDGAELVAEASATTIDIAAPPPVTLATAAEASLTSPFRETATHPFHTCFTCGPNRDEGDGLRLFAGRVPGTDSFAVPWTPTEVNDEIVWAALDCPSSAVIYLNEPHPPPHVLGRIAARIDHRPQPGEPHVIMSWPLEWVGRKVLSASAIFDSDTRVCAVARATWIRLADDTGCRSRLTPIERATRAAASRRTSRPRSSRLEPEQSQATALQRSGGPGTGDSRVDPSRVSSGRMVCPLAPGALHLPDQVTGSIDCRSDDGWPVPDAWAETLRRQTLRARNWWRRAGSP
jgi:hypothetical protein